LRRVKKSLSQRHGDTEARGDETEKEVKEIKSEGTGDSFIEEDG
jgi:hypothetical protein